MVSPFVMEGLRSEQGIELRVAVIDGPGEVAAWTEAAHWESGNVQVIPFTQKLALAQVDFPDEVWAMAEPLRPLGGSYEDAKRVSDLIIAQLVVLRRKPEFGDTANDN